VSAGETPDLGVEPEPVPEKPTTTAGRRKQRPSVPSWDDIMFGTKRD